MSSCTWKQIFPELVFGIIRKSELKRERFTNDVVDVRLELV